MKKGREKWRNLAVFDDYPLAQSLLLLYEYECNYSYMDYERRGGMESNYGLISLIPVAVVIITAVITRRALEPLILGAVVGFLILAKENFVVEYLAALYKVIGENAYFIVIFGLFGIYIKLLTDANATSGFTKVALKFANTKKKTGVLAWFMGIIFFLDNYFSILGAAVSNIAIADKNKMSREMFAFSVNMVACATCIIIPYALWGTYMSSQIEIAMKMEAGTGLAEVIKAVPFMFYAWISLIFVLLYHFRIIKPFGPMKLAEQRAETTGKLLPEDIEEEAHIEDEQEATNILNFIIPMVALIAVTLVTKELTYGLLVGIILCVVMYIPQKLIKLGEALDSICAGFSDMMGVTAIVISAFVLQAANTKLGLAPFVVNSAKGIMSAELLPMIAFLVLLVLGFVTGSFWGMAAVCFPIMLPLAEVVGAPLYLTIGAVIAGAAAGSTVCFYGDSATLTCGITKIRNIDYARTALPMIVPIIVVTAVLYGIAGFVM